jgi:hypothetical protein
MSEKTGASWSGEYVITDSSTGDIIETNKTETEEPMVKEIEPAKDILKKESE